MGLGKTYSADYLIDSNGNTGVSGQVLISTATGIDWADGSAITGGPYLPLAGGRITGTNKIEFNNGTQFIQASDGVDLKLGASDDIILETNFVRYLGAVEYARITGGANSWIASPSTSKLGIGTTSPPRKLSVETNDTATYSASVNASEISVARKNSSNTAGQVAAISLNATGWSGQTTGVVVLNAIARQGNFSNADFAIQNRVGGNFVETFRITTYGNVGIGTDTPDDNVNTGSYFKPDGGGRFLTVKDSAGSFIMLESSTTTDDDQIGGIYFNNTVGQADAHVHVAGIDAILHKHGTNDALSGGDLRFFTKPSGSGVAGPRMIILQNGNVGIGTTSPSKKLQVSGAGRVFNAVSSNDQVVASFTCPSTSAGISTIGFQASGSTSDYHVRIGANATNLVAYTNNVERLRIDSSGNVGIGTTAPLEKLHVAGKINSSNNIVSNSTYTMFTGRSSRTVDDYGGLNKQYFKANLVTPGPNTTGESSAHGIADLRFQLANSAGNTGMSDIMTLRSGGNVGIGTAGPTAKLDVKGDGADFFLQSADYKIARIQPRGTGADLDRGLFSLFNGNTESVRIDTAGNSWLNGGNVGIGLTAPDAPLHILRAAGGANIVTGLKLDPDDATTGSGISIDFNASTTNTGASLVGSRIVGAREGGNASGFLALYTSPDASGSVPLERLRIDSTGNVGIGTTSPGSKLEIHKSITYGSYGPASPQLNLVNTHTERTAGFLMLSARYNNTSPAQTFYPVGGIGGGKETALANNEWGGYINFFTTSDGTAGAASARFEHMRITADGNVGIGTTNPGQKLHVTGNIKADSGSSSSFVYFGANSKNYLAYDVSNSAYWRTPSVHFFEGDTGFKGAWDGVGQLGIGTTSPRSGYKLTLDKSTNVSGEFVGISIEEAGGTGYGYIRAEDQLTPDTSFVIGHTSRVLTLETGSTERVRIDNSGNVGIGTTSPVKKLQVSGSATGDLINILCVNTHDTDGDTAGIGFSMTDNDLYNKAAIFFERTTAQGIGDLHLAVNNTGSNVNVTKADARLTVKPSGNVGIGTASPAAKLDVVVSDVSVTPNGDSSGVFRKNGHNYISILSGDTSEGGVIFGNSADAADGYIAYKHGTGAADQAFAFGTANGERMRIDSSGNVGIGTTSPAYKLTIDNDAANTNNPALYVKNPNSSTAAVIAEFVGDSDSIQIKNIGTGDYAIYNSQQSNGIALFDGNGGVEIRYNGATVLEADSNGGVKVTGQLSATGDVVAYSSDERLKENIKPIESAVDKIKQLKGVTFDWNEKSEELGFEPSTKTNDVGVIAQDVEAVFPQLVQLAPFDIGSDEDGKATSKSGEDYKTVNYARLTAVLIEAVKEQQQQIDELKAKLDGITK